MNVKIQGGGSGRYSNNGSCSGTVSYLQHEDMDKAMKGIPIESFFDAQNDRISSKEVTFQIDRNKANLGRNDSKFYVLTISPSKTEIKAMGNDFASRSKAMREYTRKVMDEYALNFNRENLKNGTQIKYYAKIHHDRGNKEGLNLHCHVIVSRKCMENKLKLSPQTNHKQTDKGRVIGGFNRTRFFEKTEQVFDKQLNYERTKEQSFNYQNAMKNGTVNDMKQEVNKAVNQQIVRERKKEKLKQKRNKKDLTL